MASHEQSGPATFLNQLEKASAPFRAPLAAFTRTGGPDPGLQEALDTFPTLFPQWVTTLADYDERRFGPLLGVSDEGSAGKVIADAAQNSAKARALGRTDPAAIGVTIDGERMTSAGEVPIGPDEYREVVSAAFGRTYCTTNVGVRVNTRIYQPLPEFRVPREAAEVSTLTEQILARFEPFLGKNGASSRPLTVRLLVDTDVHAETLRQLVASVEAARTQRTKIGDPNDHRLSLLISFDNEISGEADLQMIRRILALAAAMKIGEVAIDGEVLEPARRRLSVAGLLNVLPSAALRTLLAEARQLGVRLTHRYAVDDESAARTVWTGLHTARTYGMSAAKYGLVPLTLEEQKEVVRMITSWTGGWTAVPAFYVDTPLVSDCDCFDDKRCVDAAEMWMKMAHEAGAKVVLIDSPDRITPRRLLRGEQPAPDDRGVITIAEAARLVKFTRELGLKALWSGGITPPQAYELAKLGVAGIFTTSSTAERIAVGAVLRRDPQLPFENEPTELGVRRIHALIQAGFLAGSLGAMAPAPQIEERAHTLLSAIAATNRDEVVHSVTALDESMIEGWKKHWANLDGK